MRTPRAVGTRGSHPPQRNLRRSRASRRGLIRSLAAGARAPRDHLARLLGGVTRLLQSLAQARCQPKARLTNKSEIRGATCTPRGAAHRVVSELCQHSSASLVLQPRFLTRRGRWCGRGSLPPWPCPGPSVEMWRGLQGETVAAWVCQDTASSGGGNVEGDEAGLEHLWGC